MSFLSLIPTIASVAGSLFGKKSSGGDTQPAQILQPNFQTEAGSALSDYIKKYLSQYQPGAAAPVDFSILGQETGYENTGLNRLQQFLGAPELSGLFDTTQQNLMDTLSGKFADPMQSPFIQAMTNLSRMNLNDSIDASRRSAGSRGSYFTRSAMEGENRLRERANTGLDAVIGDFINQERGRQLQASPLALALEKYKTLDVPLSKIGASQEFGGLPRLLDASQLEAQYQDFQRKQTELSGTVGTAQSLYGTQTPMIPSYTNPQVQQNNTLGNILGMISKLNLGALSGSGSILSKIGNVFGG